MPHLPPHHDADPVKTEAILTDLFAVENLMEMGLFGRFKAVSHLLRHLTGEFRKDGYQSNTRIRLLTHLVVSSRLGTTQGIAPSELSDHLGISRNTVSALLNGLEEQGLIERHLHPDDRRQLLIRITNEGTDMVRARAPGFGKTVTCAFGVLEPDEQETMAGLLDKLIENLLQLAEEKGLEVPIPGSLHDDADGD